MKRILTSCVFLLAGFAAAQAQNYQTGKRTSNFTDPARANRQVSTDLYYPADVAGNNVPIAAGTVQFPVVVFGHGFVIGTSSYERLADSLTKYGYIAAFPSTEGGILPSHDNFGKDISFLSTAIIAAGNNASSFLYQRVIPKAAVGGHSMGGGCSFLAAATGNPAIQAIFNFAAAETNPSSTSAASSVNKPALIFSGSNDCIVPASTQLAMYNNVTAVCKTYINVTNATHCQFADNNFTCSLGQITTGCNSSSITVGTLYTKITSLLIPFLDNYLKDDCERGTDFLNTYNSITGVTKLNTCNTFPSCGVVPVTLIDFSGTLTGKEVQLKWNTAAEYLFSYYELEKSADGTRFSPFIKVLPKGGPSTTAAYNAIDAYPYPGSSFYRLKMMNADGRFTYSNIIRIKTTKKDMALTGMYPNPVKTRVNLELYAGKEQKVKVRIFSILGQPVLNTAINLLKGVNEYELGLTELSPGVYFIQLVNDQNIVIQSARIVKQ